MVNFLRKQKQDNQITYGNKKVAVTAIISIFNRYLLRVYAVFAYKNVPIFCPNELVL